VPLILLALAATFIWKSISKPEPLPISQIKIQQQGKKGAGAPPEFAFAQWLAKQQMVQIVTTLQQQNPELSFDFSRTSSAHKQLLFEVVSVEKSKRFWA
jgi:hypothetical protein